MEEEFIELAKSLEELLEKANNSLKEIERLERCVHSYVNKELNNQSEKLSDEFIKYSLDKIDQALLLQELYKDAIIVINKMINRQPNMPPEIREYWVIVARVIKDEIEEQEFLGNYILDYTKGKNLTDKEKEFIDKTFKGLAKLKIKGE